MGRRKKYETEEELERKKKEYQEDYTKLLSLLEKYSMDKIMEKLK